MSLFSISFGVFLVLLFLIYFLFPRKLDKYQWVVLLVASYIFYAFAGAGLIVFLLTSTLSTWYAGVVLGRMNAEYREKLKKCTSEEKKALKQTSTKRKRRVVAAVAVLNFGILGVLKYTNFFIENLNVLLKGSMAAPIPVMKFLLPLGISFYTFQSMGYVFDVYRSKYEPDGNPLRYALFVSYFPQIIQGPIGRHNDLAHQLYEPHRFDYRRFSFGLQRAMWGYFKKMVIADRIGIWTGTVVSNYTQYEGITVFLSVMFYTLQIYADFSGGMDVVLGISEALGIGMTENFRRPYFSRSVAEFWQRWHITLGAWMREYVFYPLALSQPFAKLSKKLRGRFGPFVAKVLPTSLASFAVFILVGIWHGAGWNYVVYGLYQAVFVSTGTLFQPIYTRCRKMFRVREDGVAWKAFQTVRTIFIVTIGRYFINADDLSSAFYMMKATFKTFNLWIFFDGSLYSMGLDRRNFQLLIAMVIVLFVVDAIKEHGTNIRATIANQNIAIRWFVYYAVLFAIIIFGIYGPGYDASTFIYQHF